MVPSSNILDFRQVLHDSKNIVAVVGAGVSAASGIPTWRDSDGIWTAYDPAKLATPQAFTANPSLVWQHYHALRDRALAAVPNPAHLALALLCIPDLLRGIAPLAKFTLVTQNIDGLDALALERTIESYRAGRGNGDTCEASRLYEMHGRVLDTLCTSCDRRQCDRTSPLCPALASSSLRTAGDEIHSKDLPRCLHCGGLLRPGVVWFDEVPHHLREIWEVVDHADLCLLIGTSSQVQPAAAYAYEVVDHGGKVAVFNLEQSVDDDHCEFLFLGPCAETLPAVLFGNEPGHALSQGE
ncbi:DHS-like NAD/FAD-binding domain-containing protein [Auriscalpium vulgare]|uniref:DHS-like NAD/FAD-binding domain-containing protein n=1 Tax=Auriscalpium vulgare TaxID=40419 RepID=A0ACB8R6P0_9AGAM|nr:DHS-like NAD/FAD-binding domain-containing protein [Auriscalpium vulgare]